MSVTLVIANKRYSSWSMRPWLALRYAAGRDGFKEVKCTLKQEDTEDHSADNVFPYSEILRLSPTHKVPLLIDDRYDGVKVVESVAIMQHIAETYPEANLLPTNVAHRAHCYSIVAEMHSGFMALRMNLPHNCVAFGRRHGAEALQREDVKAEIKRLGHMWTELRTQFAEEGPYLFGKWSLADCMYAPVTFRFTAYDDEQLSSLDEFPLAKAYIHAVQSSDMVQDWVAAAREEKEYMLLDRYEKFMDA